MMKIKRIKIKTRVNVFDLLNILLTLVLFFYLEYLYKNFVYRYYDYTGYTYHFDGLKYLIGKILLLAGFYLVWKVPKDDLVFPVLFFVLLFYFVPNIIMYEFAGGAFVIVTGILLFIAFIRFFSAVSLRMPRSSISDTARFYLLLILALVMLFPFFLAYGFSINWKVFLLQDIYAVRLAARVKSTMLTGYLYSSLSKIVFPVMMIYGLLKKDYILLIVSIAGILYLFAVMAAKIVLFGMLVALFFYYGKNYRVKIFYFLLLLCGIFIAGRIATVFFGNLVPESIFVRREFFLPAYLNQVYYDYFSIHPHVYWSNSVLSPFVHPVYSLDPAFLIGREYFGDVNTRANNGIISDGYMNMGLAGVILNTLIAALIISVINAARVNSKYLGIFFIMIITFISSPLFTGLLTHGILLLLLLSVFLLRSEPAVGENRV